MGLLDCGCRALVLRALTARACSTLPWDMNEVRWSPQDCGGSCRGEGLSGCLYLALGGGAHKGGGMR